MIPLVPVAAYFLKSGGPVLLDAANRIAAEDFAQKWKTWRGLAQIEKGWELLIEPGAGSDYTRAFFRTAADQQYLIDAGYDAAGVDASAHQAGRAVDLDLSGMKATYSNYDYDALVDQARRAGITNRIYQLNGSSPWHFDDNPAGLFGSTYAAIEQVGNLFNQVAAAVAAGLETPQAVAVKKAVVTWWPLAAGGGLLFLLWITRERNN